MLVRYYVELWRQAEAVASVLRREPQAWLPMLVQDSSRRGLEMVARVGLPVGPIRLDREVTVTVSAARQLGDTWVIPIAWTPTSLQSMVPSVDGDLEVSALGPERTQLAISARYQPPLGWLGALTDRALMRRVAEATMKDFLDHVALGIETELALSSPAAIHVVGN